jgi:hypothetical protein
MSFSAARIDPTNQLPFTLLYLLAATFGSAQGHGVAAIGNDNCLLCSN